VILDRFDDATERLLDFAENVKEMVLKQMKQYEYDPEPQERITHSLVKGRSVY
jgi:5-methyltetrahydrofolate--homocysteine methyltransferase